MSDLHRRCWDNLHQLINDPAFVRAVFEQKPSVELDVILNAMQDAGLIVPIFTQDDVAQDRPEILILSAGTGDET